MSETTIIKGDIPFPRTGETLVDEPANLEQYFLDYINSLGNKDLIVAVLSEFEENKRNNSLRYAIDCLLDDIYEGMLPSPDLSLLGGLIFVPDPSFIPGEQYNLGNSVAPEDLGATALSS